MMDALVAHRRQPRRVRGVCPELVIVDFSSRTNAVRHGRRHAEMRLCHTPRRYCSRRPARVAEHRPIQGDGCTRERLNTWSSPANHKDHSQSFSIFEVSTAKIHARSDRWLRTFAEGTQRTYAYHLVDHLRWLKAVNASEEAVGLDDLRRYMALCGAEHAGPLGSPSLSAPLSAAALQVRAAVLKGYYLDVTSREAINENLKKQLTEARLRPVL